MALFFVSDRTGWWNLYRCDLASRKIDAVAPREAEFGQPQWVFGMSTYAFAGAGRLVCSYVSKGLGTARRARPEFRRLTPLDLPYTDYSSVRARATASSSAPGRPRRPRVSSCWIWLPARRNVLKQSTSLADDPEPGALFHRESRRSSFPTEGNRTAFGLYYPAFNPDYRRPRAKSRRLLVKCHGGPTAAASSTLDLRIQYWTSRGICRAGCELRRQHRVRPRVPRAPGSATGASWMWTTASTARAFLAEQGLVDGERSVITGGSAGGYTTLAALTFRDYFRGGASHYGVSDLAALVARHAQVRVALSGFAGRAVSGAGGSVSRALAVSFMPNGCPRR